jgi:hypothetical protein
MDAALEAKLIESLSALEAGESIEDILSRYPEHAARLRPLLETAAALPALRMEPSLEAKSRSREAFLALAAALQGSARPRRARFFSRPLMTFASLALALIIVAGGALAASASALPGDPLYGVKRAVENARLSLASSLSGRGALAAQFEQERISEIAALLDAGREAEVEFTGIIESIQPDAWLVAGLVVRTNEGTRIDGSPQVGLRAQVQGRTLDGMLIATAIVVEPGAGPTPEPEPRPTATPKPEVTPSPTGTPTRTLAPTRTPTPTGTPTPFEVEFIGMVEQAGAQTWIIGGVSVEVNAATEFIDSPEVGRQARVRALDSGGRLIALRIERLDGGDDNGNENENQNGDDNANINDNSNENDNENQNENGNENSNDNDNDNDNDGGDS